MPCCAKTHEECRRTLCLLCMKKGKDHRKISEEQVVQIREHFFGDYTLYDDRLPNVLCTSCRNITLQYRKGDFSKNIDVFDHAKFTAVPQTRQHENCLLCDIAKSNINPSFPLSKPRGRPSINEKPQPVKVCPNCLINPRPGVSHKCSSKNVGENSKTLLSVKNRELVASTLIGEKAQNDVKVELSTPGRKMKIEVSPSTSTAHAPISLTNMSSIQQELHLSQRSTLKLATHLRQASGSSSRSVVEPNLKMKLQINDHQLDEHFESRQFYFIQKQDNHIVERCLQPAVLCKDVEKLIEKVLEIRCVHADDDTLIRIGLDGGGGFFKICMSIFQLEQLDHEQERQVYGQRASSKKIFKDSGVHRVIILAIAPAVQENYENLKTLWVGLKMYQLEREYTIATDLKLTNIVIGIMNHSSCHPCCWCIADKQHLSNAGEERTLATLKEDFFQWFEKSERKKAKNYNNVVHPSLLKHINPSTPVLDLIPPPELHLFIGPVNTMYNGLAEVWDNVEEWTKACHIHRDAQYGGTFAGNACRTLLENLDLLQAICPLPALKYVEAFRSFKKVVSACYGANLDTDYQAIIGNFKAKYLDLGLSITPKIHAIFHHVPDFCRRKNRGLAAWSEQTSESLHHDFNMVWKDFKVNRLDHPDYPSRLCRCVSIYNSRHL